MCFHLRTTVGLVILCLVSSLAVGCGPEDPAQRPDVASTADADTGHETVDGGADTTAADARQPDTSTDGGLDSGTSETGMADSGAACVADEEGTCVCQFRGLDEGVCVVESGLTDGGCPEPDAWESTESSCDGLDNDCDGATDEGCACDYKGFDSGVCANQTRDDQGLCPQPSLFQGDESRCDQRDNDCDGASDEGCACSRGDGKTGVCANPGTLNAAGDCRVSGWERVEATCDGLDNDCDGATDENCQCDYKQKGRGVCAGLTRDAKGTCPEPGDWEATESSCDGKDNDCDGASDEGCGCDYRNKSRGVCANRTLDNRGVCPQPKFYEANEIRCDSRDNDCDGAVDEGCTCKVGDGKTGVCSATGTKTSAGRCEVSGYEADESSCDARDNDCDGAVDEACPCNYLLKREGVCFRQTRDGAGMCPQPTGYQPAESKCDGKDNDCDGAADEGCSCDYRGKKKGVCRQLTRNNDGGCPQPADYQATEVRCDGMDNDCDGATDENCTCNYNGQAAGLCKGLTRDKSGTCPRPAGWEAPTNKEASCDGKDNDCDGVADEGCSCNYNGLKTGVCKGQTLSTTGACPRPSAYEPKDERSCDQVDNDCDGLVDENDLKKIYRGNGYKCGLDPAGQAYCWGTNKQGRLGVGTNFDQKTPTPVQTNVRFEKLSLGERHACGLTAKGVAYCWGANRNGQLGDGTQSDRYAPVKVQTNQRFGSIAVVNQGLFFDRQVRQGNYWNPYSSTRTATTAVTRSGEIYWWGHESRTWDSCYRGDSGRTEKAAKTPSRVQTPFRAQPSGLVAGGGRACALTAGNRVLCWGLTATHKCIYRFDTSFVSPAIADKKRVYRDLAISARDVYGLTVSGDLRDISNGKSLAKPKVTPVSIAARGQSKQGKKQWGIDVENRAIALLSKSGTVHVRARNQQGSFTWTKIKAGATFTQVSSGGKGGCALQKKGGDAYCWPEDASVQCF